MPPHPRVPPARPAEAVRFWRDARLPFVEASLVVASRHVFPRHAHDHFAIGLMEQGANYCLGPGRDEAVVTSGRIALLNPGQMHTGNPAEGVASTYRMLFVDPEWVSEMADEDRLHAGGDMEFARVVVAAPEAWQAFQGLSAVLAGQGPPLAGESLLVQALAGLIRRFGALARPQTPVGNEPGRAALARDFLHARPDAAVTLGELAQAAGLSRFHLLRVFRRATGLTPHAYHLQLRVEAARRLLRAGMPIAQAAAQAGFADQSHLNRVFKRYAGVTPGVYAGRCRG